MGLKLLYLCLAGAAGTLARYGLSGWVSRGIGTTFPIGTAAVNIAGCLFFGLLWALLESRLPAGGQIKTILFIGFFGAFTTFSTFAFETCCLLEDSQWLWAGGNIAVQTVLCIAALFVGLKIGRWI